ncbi:hypothetical protein O999_10820 [Pseudomonas putida LF54]|uniref:hypothetical protein n=1 Tax=Pseudomonas putida TaxID=303 RepID=UPI0003AEA5EA|nr:hypothetical protein [Pseudomonas putida]ERK99708.1 hypothetical protein O999_10820 [Pseudomonas putida LF54]
MGRILYFAMLITSSILSAGAAGDPQVEQDSLELYAQPNGLISVDQYGAVKRQTRWSNPVINVCWDEHPINTTEENYRAIVELAVVSSWPKYSDVRFIGWRVCKDSRERGIHITVRDEAPRTKGLGRYLDGRAGGMVLNFDFKNWRPACRVDKSKEDCVKYLAVHEFGHALGFIHEHTRSDAPECAADVNSVGARGVKLISKYDEKSIMNYCSPTWKMYSNHEEGNDQALEILSPLDKYSVAQHYKLKTAERHAPLAMEN